jgi:hypothetical protein
MPQPKKKTGGRRPGAERERQPESPLPAYDEGRVESVHEGRGLGRDEDPRTGQKPSAPGAQDPKLADQDDAFVSSEAVAHDPDRTTS